MLDQRPYRSMRFSLESTNQSIENWPDVCTNDIKSETDSFNSVGTSSISFKNRRDTLWSASWGQSWNQSIDVQLTRAGNFRALTRNFVPTGEKHRTTLSVLLTLSMKNFQQFSLESSIPVAFTSFLTPEIISSIWSSGNKSGISPEAKRSLIRTKKSSCGTWASVIKNITGWFFTPALIRDQRTRTVNKSD